MHLGFIKLKTMLSGDVTKRYQIPIENFDFAYIAKSTDVRELCKILKVLRSGNEGYFPDLERTCEKRIEELDPQNRILRKEAPARTKYDLPPEEWQQIAGDLSQWIEEVSDRPVGEFDNFEDEEYDHCEDVLKNQNGDGDEEAVEVNENLPPVRGSNLIVKPTIETAAEPTEPPKASEPKKTQKQRKAAAKKNKRMMPRSYKEWDKIDVESELKKIDEEEENKSKTAKEANKVDKKESPASSSPASFNIGEINKSILSESEVEVRSEREKEKGNEAFRSGDYDEALAYYNRSLSLHVTMAALNNRAFTYLKLEKWDHAVKDCNTVLAEDPKNLKALYRRASAYKSRKQFAAAKKDLEKVLGLDSSHLKAIEMLTSVNKSIETAKKEGNRLVIEDVSEGSEGEAENETHFGKTTLSHHDVEKSHQEPESPVVDTQVKSEEVQATKIEIEDIKPVKELHTPSVKVETPKPRDDVIITEVPVDQLLEEVTKLKNSAGKLFSDGNYKEAMANYEAGIKSVRSKSRIWLDDDQTSAQANNLRYTYGLLLTNAAACFIKLKQYQDCIEHCTESLKFVHRFAKTHLRRATAYEGLERYEDALTEYSQVLEIESNSKSATEGVKRCQLKVEEIKRKEAERVGSRIAIEEDDESEEEFQDDDNEAVSEQVSSIEETTPQEPSLGSVEIVKLAPGASAFDFAQAWASMVKTGRQILQSKSDAIQGEHKDEEGYEEKKDEEFEFIPDATFYEPYLQFILQIPVNQISKVFANQMDGTSFSTVINCLHFGIVVSRRQAIMETSKAANCLIQLSWLSRFGVAAMFLSSHDKQKLTELIAALMLTSQLDDTLKNQLQKQFAKYCTKQ